MKFSSCFEEFTIHFLSPHFLSQPSFVLICTKNPYFFSFLCIQWMCFLKKASLLKLYLKWSDLHFYSQIKQTNKNNFNVTVASWSQQVVSFLKKSTSHSHTYISNCEMLMKKTKSSSCQKHQLLFDFSVRLQRNSWAGTRLQPLNGLWMEPHLRPPKRCSPYCLHMEKGASLSHTDLLVQWEKPLTSC